MRVLVTGGSGFIGRIFTEKLLARNCEVIVLTRNPENFPINNHSIRIFKADLSSPNTDLYEKIFKLNIDVVCHLAAEFHDPKKMYEINYCATRYLFDASRGKIKTWIQLSSVGVYGVDNNSGIVTDKSNCNPKTTYELTKLLADKYLIESATQAQDKIFIFRPSNVIGEKMSSNWLRGLCWALLNRSFFYIGDNKSVINYVEVNDLIKVIINFGIELNVSGGIYIVSRKILLINLIESLNSALGISGRSYFRINKSLVIFVINVCKFMKINIPLTKNKLDALTNTTIFISSQSIFTDDKNSVIEDQFFRIASFWKKSGEIGK